MRHGAFQKRDNGYCSVIKKICLGNYKNEWLKNLEMKVEWLGNTNNV